MICTFPRPQVRERDEEIQRLKAEKAGLEEKLRQLQSQQQQQQ